MTAGGEVSELSDRTGEFDFGMIASLLCRSWITGGRSAQIRTGGQRGPRLTCDVTWPLE